jgi:iron complex outermembrane recepter protein
MGRWYLYASVRLSFLISLSGCLSIIAVSSVSAQDKPHRQDVGMKYKTSSQIPQLGEIELPATNAQLLVQQPTPTNPPATSGEVIAITGVKASPTEKGVEVILETAQGDKLQLTNRSTGNNFIADIPNTQLRLSSGEAFTFRSEKPIKGITEITVTNIDANTVRVAVVGENALPTVELFDDDAGLVFAVASTTTATQPPQTPPTEEQPASETPAAQQDDPIELVVTGERDGYNVPNASTATRTDTPLRDIPQSIQVVPQEVLRDRKVRNLTEAVETVSGVGDGGTFLGVPGGRRIIRGFGQGFQGSGATFRDGAPDADFYIPTSIGTIEQVEVLKGPASVLFGSLEPGGVVNTITRKPLSEPYYNLGFEVGNYGYFQPSLDLSVPLDTNKTLLYRFIAGYQTSETIQPFINENLTTIAPSITWKLGDKTSLNLYYEYVHFFSDNLRTSYPRLSDGSLLPRDFYVGYPSLDLFDITAQRFGYKLEHKFNDNWQLRNNLSVSLSDFIDERSYAIGVVDDRFVEIESYAYEYTRNFYFGQIDLVGKFKTGSISHQLLVGFDINRYVEDITLFSNNDPSLPLLDIRNPNYDIPKPVPVADYKGTDTIQSYGVYLQDQINFNDNLKMLIGGRYDWSSYENEIADFGLSGNTVDDPVQRDGAFSPRIGLVYQPSQAVSLYASYSSSFKPSPGFNPDGRFFEPTRGMQYEVGVKTDFLNGRLSTTLAAYHLTKTNVTTEDPNNPRFSIQTGEQRSQGIELDIAGEILPGWKVIVSYAYTDAEVTKDNTTPVGNKLPGVAENQASLWTTYEIQKGDLKGLGFGLGLFYVGERQGNLANSFQLDSYFRTDAALFYRRDGFNAAINVRNLFDVDYASYAFRASGVQRGAPFTIIGSVSWEF